jgi:hypothetical protein
LEKISAAAPIISNNFLTQEPDTQSPTPLPQKLPQKPDKEAHSESKTETDKEFSTQNLKRSNSIPIPFPSEASSTTLYENESLSLPPLPTADEDVLDAFVGEITPPKQQHVAGSKSGNMLGDGDRETSNMTAHELRLRAASMNQTRIIDNIKAGISGMSISAVATSLGKVLRMRK